MFADAGISAVLSGEALDAVHEHAMTILEEIGTDVRHEGALAMLAGLGQDIDGERVHWDREFVMEMTDARPGLVHAREPAIPRGRSRSAAGSPC